jgi:hypothetical protein
MHSVMLAPLRAGPHDAGTLATALLPLVSRTLILLPKAQREGARAAKRDTRVAAHGPSLNQAMTRTMLITTAVMICWRWVRTRPR